MKEYAFPENDFSHVLKNIEKYAQSFVRHGLFGIKKAYFTTEEAERILEAVGEVLGWSLPPLKEMHVYHQSYDEQIRNEGTKSESENMIQWHLEGVSSKYPQRAAGWNMYKFSCIPGTGATGFVDTSKLWQNLPSHHKGFLNNTEIIHFPIFSGDETKIRQSVEYFATWVEKNNKVIWLEINNELVPSFARKALGQHPNSGLSCLMVCPCEESFGVQDFLLSVAGRAPSKDHKNQFIELFKWLHKEIAKTENQIWWEWDEGDFVVPDLYRMIHTAQGGFDVGQRAFHGNWCFSKNADYSFQQKIDASAADVDYLNEMCCDPFDETLNLYQKIK